VDIVNPQTSEITSKEIVGIETWEYYLADERERRHDDHDRYGG